MKSDCFALESILKSIAHRSYQEPFRNMSSNNTSSHILNASSNLLGICFVVLTSLRLLNLNEKSIIDEGTGIATVLLMSSCVFSFLSLRSNTPRGAFYERIADRFFMTALAALFLITMLIVFNFI